MTWETASAQSLGGRADQEDAFIVAGGDGTVPLVLAVADGAGGHAAGDRASGAAIGHIEANAGASPPDAGVARAWLVQIVRGANASVLGLGGVGPGAPRTTIVVAWLGTDRGLVVHVGDSRLYQFRGGKLVFRTSDHSVVQVLLDMGRISEDDARTHPDRSRLLKALGGDGDVSAEIGEFALEPGDGLALCSDGVWDHVSAEEVAKALDADSLDTAARDLVTTAVTRGGANADNATLVLARLRPAPDSRIEPR